MVLSPSDFIDKQGIAAVAASTGRSPGYVRVWKCRDYFPRTVWPELMRAFPDDLSLDVLQRFEVTHLRKRRKAA